MFGYLPKKEREIIRIFFEENYLYQEKKRIDWGSLNTVSKLSNCIKMSRNDPYSKVEPIMTERQISSNYYLNFAKGTLYVYLKDFLEIDPIYERISRGDYHKIIVNLSENSGGFVREMLKLSGLLILDPVKLCFKYKSHEHKYDIPGNSLLQGKSVYVITSKNTVSSAEILAFIMNEGNSNCVIGGEQTYGKGEGQVTFTSPKYKYRFSLTAFEWEVNGLNCEELKKKYEKAFDESFLDISTYIDKWMAI